MISPTPEETAEFMSWPAQGEKTGPLAEVCLLHDEPLTVVTRSGTYPSGRVAAVCGAECSKCQRPVCMVDSVDYTWLCGSPPTKDVEALCVARVKHAMLLAYNRHLRLGWRIYDRITADEPQPRVSEVDDFVSHWLPTTGDAA